MGYLTSNGTDQATVWEGQTVLSLHPSGAVSSHAYAIAGDQVVGSVDNSRAVIWNRSSGSVTDISPSWTYQHAIALATNGTTQGGYARAYPTDLHALLWEGTAQSARILTPFGSNDARCQGVLIDLQVGGANFPSDPPSAILWHGTRESAENLTGYLSPDYTSSTAYSVWKDVEGTVYIAGTAFSSSGGFQEHATLWISERGNYYPPTSFELPTGFLAGGSLGSLASCDDDRVLLNPGAVLSSQQFPVTVIVKSNLDTSQPARFAFLIDTSTTSYNNVQEVALYNYRIGAFTSLSSDVAKRSDYLTRLELTQNATDFVEPGTREVKARIRFRSTGPALSFPWFYRVDRATWWVPEN